MKQVLLSILCAIISLTVLADSKLVYKFDIKQNIAPATWRQTQQAFAEAEESEADLILIHMNTYGGAVLDADSIRSHILESKIPVYVFIDKNAASAGALISIACDSIYMSKGANIGAATVVNQQGQAMPDKYQSYMRSVMRSTAEAQGKDTVITANDTIISWRRNPKIAEAMVDQSLYVAGVSDSGKVLTFTPTEAIKYGFCEAVVDDVDVLLERTGFSGAEIKEYQPTALEKVIGFLVNPVVAGLLLMAIIGGIYFEMQTPGVGFPLIISLLAATFYFAPHYLEGLAANWEIIIFFVGIILIGIEIFVIPGFGFAGIIGIILMFGGLILSLIDNINFDFEHVESSRITIAVATVSTSMLFGFLGALYLSKRLLQAESGVFSKIALHSSQELADGYVSSAPNQHMLVGKTGVAFTVLRPSGKIKIDNEIYDAVSQIAFIEKGTKVKVVHEEATQLYVEPDEEKK